MNRAFISSEKDVSRWKPDSNPIDEIIQKSNKIKSTLFAKYLRSKLEKVCFTQGYASS